MAADGITGDDDPLKKRVRVLFKNIFVLECPRLPFIPVDDQIFGLGVGLRDKAPFCPRRKSGPAKPLKIGFLDLINDLRPASFGSRLCGRPHTHHLSDNYRGGGNFPGQNAV